MIMNWMRSQILDIRRRVGAGDRYRMSCIFRIRDLWIMGLFMIFLASHPVAAQNTATGSSSGDVGSYARVSFKSNNLRDPFLNPLLKQKGAKKDREVDRGLPPPGITGTFIEEAELKGISIREDRRMAIVRGNGNRAYFLMEGDKLFDGYLKTIHRDSITLVRETKMRSGKVVTQEVTKKLRTQ